MSANDIVKKTIWPLLGGTIVGILAFAPVGFAAGNTAEFTNHLFWVILISLLFSWVFAITLVPFIASLLFKNEQADEKPESKFLGAYKKLVYMVLKFRWLVVVAVVCLFGLSVWGTQYIKPGFFPASATPQLVIDYWLPEGTGIHKTTEDAQKIEQFLMSQNSVETLQTLIGQGALRYLLVYNPEFPNPAYAQFIIKLKDFKQIPALQKQVKAYLATNYPNAQTKAWVFQLGPAGGSKIEAQFSGPDPKVLRRLANDAKAIMQKDNGATYIKDDWRQQVPVIEPYYQDSRGRRLGISKDDLAEALRANFSGLQIGTYREGNLLLPIVVKATEKDRLNTETIATLPVISSQRGQSTSLLDVVEKIETNWHDSQLRRLNRQWTITAQCDPVDELASTLEARIKPDIEAIDLPTGYELTWQGESGDSAEAQKSLAATIPLGLAAMVLVVVLLFNRIRQSLIIWLVVPLALIGVVLGLVTTGMPMEFMAILGVLSLSGLLIKNAIVLVDQMDVEIAEGKEPLTAIVDSAANRLRPVMMGALTTILGILPLFSDTFFRSMAVVMSYGLSFATVITLLFVPVLYSIFLKVDVNQ